MCIPSCLYNYSTIKEHPFPVHTKTNIDGFTIFSEFSCLVAILYTGSFCHEFFCGGGLVNKIHYVAAVWSSRLSYELNDCAMQTVYLDKLRNFMS